MYRDRADSIFPKLFASLLSTAIGEGTGSLTPPAIGDADGNRLTLDNEAIWHPVKAEELRQYGQRRVENLLSFSEDITTWSGTGITADTQ